MIDDKTREREFGNLMNIPTIIQSMLSVWMSLIVEEMCKHTTPAFVGLSEERGAMITPRNFVRYS